MNVDYEITLSFCSHSGSDIIELETVHKWFDFGIKLGLTFGELKIIESDYKFVHTRGVW